MPFWTFRANLNQWKSQSCYMVCTSGAATMYATKRNNARWSNDSTAAPYVIDNNPNQRVFPGGSLLSGAAAAPPVVPPDVDTRQVAVTEFLEETGLQTIALGGINGQYELRNGPLLIATAARATFFHGASYHAMILWLNTVAELQAVANTVTANIAADDARYALVPRPVNGYARHDDELASVTVTPPAFTNWVPLFNGAGQDWFLNIGNGGVNV